MKDSSMRTEQIDYSPKKNEIVRFPQRDAVGFSGQVSYPIARMTVCMFIISSIGPSRKDFQDQDRRVRIVMVISFLSICLSPTRRSITSAALHLPTFNNPHDQLRSINQYSPNDISNRLVERE